ncbi:MAG TPA: M24 family metallopeptidase, partial [Candidatus Sulfotelmatobacter sp.]|nr:M24 family metallopeptidase [Candidatus Sulfotelmatobacter sp.]
PQELERVRAACRIGREAFEEGAKLLQVGMTEPEAANAFRAPLSAHGKGLRSITRADGAVWCMSGPNSAQAYAAYARTRARSLGLGDFAMLHCNSYADGYWTDITRTYCFGDLEERQQAMYEAVLAARRTVLETIRPGLTGAEVDHAAREVLAERGFGKEFKHPTGHGVGFAAISHNAQPRLHPASPDVLETGMVFNVEPAIYIEAYGGLRHCDMVAVTKTGAELLTPFQAELEDLVIS